MRRAHESNYSLESIDRMVAVVSALESANPQSLDEVARRAGLNESTALRYLLSLAKHDFVERDNTTGKFRLGLRLFQLGTLALEARDIGELSRPVIAKLLDSFGESVNLATRSKNNVVLIRVVESQNPVRKGAREGEIDSWHATSLGKALLAAMSQEEALSLLLQTPLIAYTPNTLVDTQLLLRDLQSICSRGYSIDDEESVEGLRCVGAAIRDYDRVPLYAISVSGPKSRMPYTRIQEIGTALVESAQQLSQGLGAR